MAIAENEINVLKDEIVDNKELTSLIRSVSKDGVKLLLEVKYGFTLEKAKTFSDFADLVVNHDKTQDIVTDLVEISDCIKEVDHDSFAELCNSYGVNIPDFHELLPLTAVRCFLNTDIALFQRMKIVAAVNKEKQFEVLGGKDITEPINFEDKQKDEMKAALGGLVEKGRNYIVNVEKVKNNIIMTAHFDNRKKTFTTISNDNEISTITVIPASKVEAKYEVNSNNIQLKCGPNKKIKDLVLSAFGQVLFKDNTHFSVSARRVYKLEKVKNQDFSMELDDILKAELESATIIEETIRIPQGDSYATISLKSKDVESLLSELSTDKYDLKKMERSEVTIEMRLVANGEAKPKTVKVTISDSNKVSYDPKYTELVNKCLTKWGIYVGKPGN